MRVCLSVCLCFFFCRPQDANETVDWSTIYTGELNQFDVRELLLNQRYDFRVRAVNSVGFSDWIQTEDPLEIPFVSGKLPEEITIISD